MKLKLPFLGLALAALASTATAQSYQTVAYESFDYAAGNLGGQAGGTGWFNSWWSGAGEDGALVTSPGIDGVGLKCTTNLENEGSYRVPESGPHPDLAPDFRFGSGDGVMWISFSAQSVGTDDYAGVSLNEQFVGEKLFIGSPFQSGAWGVADPVGGGSFTVAGSDVTVLTDVVVRITFGPAGDTVDMWLNPGVAHPATVPDGTLAVADFAWNEIRIQSGANNGGTTGYDFDDLLIEKELQVVGANYCSTNANSTGGPASIVALGSDVANDNYLILQATDLPSNQFGYFLASQTQGFAANPNGSQGNICLGGGIARFINQIGNTGAGNMLEIQVDLSSIPEPPGLNTAVIAGSTWNFQCWFRDLNPGTTSNFTNGTSITFQ